MGIIKVNNHFWENGNVQFHLSRKYDWFDLEDAAAGVIVKELDRIEGTYQKEVEDTLEHSKDDIFKKMRRVAPVYGGKFDWLNPKAVNI